MIQVTSSQLLVALIVAAVLIVVYWRIVLVMALATLIALAALGAHAIWADIRDADAIPSHHRASSTVRWF